MASVASALVQKLNRFFPLNQDELASLAGLEARRRPITAHTEIVYERQEGHRAFILQEGWACAYKLLPDGGRQVIDFSVPRRLHGPAQRAPAHLGPWLRGRERQRRRRSLGAGDDRQLSAAAGRGGGG